MTRLINELRKLKPWNDNRGTELIEFALVGGFIAVVAVGALTGIGSKVTAKLAELLPGLGG